MTHRFRLAPFVTAIALTSMLLAPAAWAKKDVVGAVGLGQTGSFGAYLGNGSRLNETGGFSGGSQVVLHLEGGAFFIGTPLGNMGGIEGGMDMGYDGIPYRKNDNVLYGAAMLADFWLGFPITLLNLGTKDRDTLRVAFTPGIGMSMVAAYAYLRLRGAYAISDTMDAELSWVWWPGAASSLWKPANQQEGLNAARIRGAILLHGAKRDETGGWMFYAEYQRGQRERENHDIKGDPSIFSGMAPFPRIDRSQWEHVLHLGFGYMM